MKPIQPFQVIYQTAEDGLGDTVKPRLIEAAADLDRVLVIDEAKRELTLSDERIEKAIAVSYTHLLTAPYSEERREAARQYARENSTTNLLK